MPVYTIKDLVEATQIQVIVKSSWHVRLEELECKLLYMYIV